MFRDNKAKIIFKNEEQIEGIKQSSILAAKTLKAVAPFVKAGVTTQYLNDVCKQFMYDNKAKSATLGYHGYPKETCISVNDVICHGIPGKYELRDGDILNIDVTTCLNIGIRQCFEGNRVGLIGVEIEKYARSQGYSVVYEFCGHGVGLKFHEEPEINHSTPEDLGPVMKAGMIFTIEPMINAGKARSKVDKKDNWTARTIDGKLSAQFEHTLCVTKTIPFVLSDIDNEFDIPSSVY
ncbi:MAG: M24 family metallopeptidase [Bacteroidetes bacterium]|nr:M24 family metallopeptidase [Bacteroidota bacterium]